MQEIAVVQSLQTNEVKLQITLGFERLGQFAQVELEQFFVKQTVVYALFDEQGKVVHVLFGHLCIDHFFAQYFLGNGVHQQSGRRIGVVGVFFEQGARGQNRGFVDFFHGYAVVQIAHGFSHDRIGFDVSA